MGPAPSFKGTTADSMKWLCFNGGQGHPQIFELGPLTLLNCWCLCVLSSLCLGPSVHFHLPFLPWACHFRASCRSLLLKDPHSTVYVRMQYVILTVALRGPEATWGWRLYHVHVYPQSRALCLPHRRSFVERKSSNFKMLITTKE